MERKHIADEATISVRAHEQGLQERRLLEGHMHESMQYQIALQTRQYEESLLSQRCCLENLVNKEAVMSHMQLQKMAGRLC